MPFLPLGPAADTFAGAFGVTMAVLLIGGPLVLRWQRNSHQFKLAQAAIASGVTRFPKGPPFWLLSLRQGITALTLGVALLIVGSIAFGLTCRIDVPAPAAPAGPPATTLPDRIARAADAAPRPGRESPPQPNLPVEEWHRLKTINTLGLMTLGSGFVLALLGVMRIAFAATERRHARDEEPIP
jgi:hypothetical protein